MTLASSDSDATSPFKSVLSSRTSGEVKADSISVTLTELWVKRAPHQFT